MYGRGFPALRLTGEKQKRDPSAVVAPLFYSFAPGFKPSHSRTFLQSTFTRLLQKCAESLGTGGNDNSFHSTSKL
jgi:hypothetical protein